MGQFVPDEVGSSRAHRTFINRNFHILCNAYLCVLVRENTSGENGNSEHVFSENSRRLVDFAGW